MSFLSRIVTGGNSPPEARAANISNIPTPYEDSLMQSPGGTPEGNPMAVGAFYACVTLLADTIASLSIDAYKNTGNGPKTLVEPQPKLFQDSPYPGVVTWFGWLWMMMESLAVTGNAFGFIATRGPDGRATSIMPVHPDDIQIEVPTDESVAWPEPVYRIRGQKVPTADIVHVRRYPNAGRVTGMSPIQMAANSIGLSLAAERYGLRWFKDSANPSGLLISDQDLTPDQVKRNMKQWMISHQGRRLPAIMSGGLKWQTVSITPEESQFLQTRQYQRSDIAMWFRIPPHMIGDTEKSTSWGTGIEEQTIGFVTYTLRPWLTCIEQVLSQLLPRGTFAKFNIDGLLRGDVKTRWEAYKMGREAGVYSVDEIREMEDLPPVPNGDGRLQPMNFVPLGTDPAEVQKDLAQMGIDAQKEAAQNSQLNTPADDGEEEDNANDSP